MSIDTSNAAQMAALPAALKADRTRTDVRPQDLASETFLAGLAGLAQRDAAVGTVESASADDDHLAQAA